MRLFHQATLASGLTVGFVFSAIAHPELKSAEPQANTIVSSPAKIELKFTENLVVRFSVAKLTMTGMKGLPSHSPITVAAKVSPGSSPKSLELTPHEPLPAGTYRVDWRAVSSDTHPVTGNYSFSVK